MTYCLNVCMGSQDTSLTHLVGETKELKILQLDPYNTFDNNMNWFIKSETCKYTVRDHGFIACYRPYIMITYDLSLFDDRLIVTSNKISNIT